MKRLTRPLTALALLAVALCSRAQDVVVYPVAATVPENLLRIELRFSKPLMAHLDARAVTLVDERGQLVPDAFLDLALPDASGSELTILMHPGRVKSGVGANLSMGRALHAGESVTLIVADPAIGAPTRKTWRIVPAQAQVLDPGRWVLRSPTAGTRDPVIVEPDTTFGLAAESRIAVRAPDGSRLSGHAALEEGSGAWHFVPDRPWIEGRYALLTHLDLEDVSGNRSCEPFEGKRSSLGRCDAGTETAFQVAAAPTP